MNEDVFNMQVRRFLKKVGIQSQREIEQAVREALERGQLTGTEALQAHMLLTVAPLGIEVEISDQIALE